MLHLNHRPKLELNDICCDNEQIDQLSRMDKIDYSVLLTTMADDTIKRQLYGDTLRLLHRISGLILLIFLSLHMVNHAIGLFDQADHIAVMVALRPLYRNPVVEPVLLTLFAVQGLSGLTIVVRGWRRRAGLVAWLQACSGLYLAAFLLNHVVSVLYGRTAMGLDTDFRFAAAGFHVSGFGWFFAPYYALAIAALFTHLGCAVFWWTHTRHPRLGGAALMTLSGGGVVFGVLMVAAMAGLLYPVIIPASYLNTYR